MTKHFIVSKFSNSSKPYRRSSDGPISYTVLSRDGTLYEVAGKIWHLALTGDFSSIPVESLNELCEKKLVVDSSTEELIEILSENNIGIEENRDLAIVIQPTALCQLGCNYCGQEHTADNLDPSNIAATIERIKQKADPEKHDRLTIRWFGGEPLLALEVIREISRALIPFAAELGLEYSASMTTNGVRLYPKIAKELYEVCKVVSFEITLDGDSETHNVARPHKGGAGSFAMIYQNLMNLSKRSDILPFVSLRCNVDSNNLASFERLVERIDRDGFADKLGALYPCLIFNWGNEAGNDNELSFQEFADWELEVVKYLIAKGIKTSVVPRRKKITCLALKKDSELIDPFGNIFNCSEVSLVPAYEVGNTTKENYVNKYQIGTLGSGTDDSKRSILGDFNATISNGEVPCANCSILPVCGGGCPKQWAEGSAPCPPHKANITQRLTLAGLHLQS
ncbi:MAG: radical SAM protein [Tateyamaria sp.]|uniref:radical SAM protein n=1 Tax=Tateyamaria sp. TaxID=1929288 RepID=UPI00329F05A2